MNRDNLIQEELLQLQSRLAGLPKLHAFAAPDPAYLDDLPRTLTFVAQLASVADPEPKWTKDLPFEVPNGYFAGLPEDLSRAAAGALPGVRVQPFETPEGYFGTLPARLMAGVKAEETPAPGRKTIAFGTALRRRRTWIAAAAVVAGLWFGIDRMRPAADPETRVQAALAGLDRDSLGNYVERHADEFEPETIEAAYAGAQISNLKQSVSELRSDEIEAYLEDAEPEPETTEGI